MDIPPKGIDGPLSINLLQYGTALGAAVLGGLVSWIGKVSRGETRGYAIMGLIGELVTSAFAGLIAFWMANAFNTPPFLLYALVGISGHMGVKAITVFEQFAERKWGDK